MAVLAAGLVLGLGATMTLAVWNDSEWVYGGADTDGDGIVDVPGVGTSTFEVQQNTSTPYSDTAWIDAEVSPGGGLNFTLDALSLTPGDTVYAPVSLTTTATSVAVADLTLVGAVDSQPVATSADPDGALLAALDLRVVARSSVDAAVPAVCDGTAFVAGATFVVGTADATTRPALEADGTAATTLAAAGADKADYCFEITLPAGSADTLQGLNVVPTWQFVANSVE